MLNIISDVQQILVKDENAHLENRIINGEIVTTTSFEQSDGLESSSETPALWEVNILFSISIISSLELLDSYFESNIRRNP